MLFGEWLRQSRSELRLTREEFATRIGCSVSTLRKIEDGQRRPSAQIAELIANSLNIPGAQRPTFVRVARGELGMDRLSATAPALASVNFPTAPTTERPRNNLPILATPIVGRQNEVAELVELLQDADCRLLTLVGPGGVGKTRLAIEVASRMEETFSDGAYFIPLGSANSTRQVVPVIADAIGFAFQSAGRADPKSQLLSYLRDKEALLVADNLEHLLNEPDNQVLGDLLANAPRVKLLVTSRESSGLPGEWVFEVEGLPVPAGVQTPASAQNTSVELFVQRARRAHVGFNMTAEDYPAIVRICELVEGMPLGIELAAAWVRTLCCDDMVREMERGLDFLSVTTRDLPARHRSMRAVFDQSWNLLTEEEQEVLLRLSLFHGGFRQEAAAAVAAATLPVLSALVTKSMIRRSGGGRYDLHGLIRRFAAERFAERAGARASTQERHGSYYLSSFRQAEARLHSPAHREALTELIAEMDNFRAAWDWAITNREFDLIEQCLRTIWTLYDTRGWFQEGVEALGRAVMALEDAVAGSAADPGHQKALGHMLATRAWFAYRLAQYESAKAMLERSLQILRPLHEPGVLAEALANLGMLMEVTGDYEGAMEKYAEGLDAATTAGDRVYRGVCLMCLNARLATSRGTERPEEPHGRLQAAVAEWRLIGDPRITGFGLRLLSQSALVLERYDEARTALDECLALNISIGDRWGVGAAYRGLGVAAQIQGEHPRAIEMFRKSLDTFIELGGSWWVARVLAETGTSVLALGDPAEAERVARESLRIASETRSTPVALEALANLASVEARRGNIERAFDWLVFVIDQPASFEETKRRAELLRAEWAAQLSGPQVEAAQARAAASTLEQIVHAVLGQIG